MPDFSAVFLADTGLPGKDLNSTIAAIKAQALEINKKAYDVGILGGDNFYNVEESYLFEPGIKDNKWGRELFD